MESRFGSPPRSLSAAGVRQSLSNTLEATACRDALRWGQPLIFNTDQGSQFTSVDFLKILKGRSIRISMDGRGRAIDNILIERFWRSIKYELIYVSDFADGIELHQASSRYIDCYNFEWAHRAIQYATPARWFPPARDRQPRR